MIVSILDLMDCRVKTVMPVKLELNPDRVSILDLMDCRVKTGNYIDIGMIHFVFQSLI